MNREYEFSFHFKSGFPIWFMVHYLRELVPEILAIFVLLRGFATHFLVSHWALFKVLVPFL